MRELIHPVSGLARVWPDARGVRAERREAAPVAQAGRAPVNFVTGASIAAHAQWGLMTPVSPDRARQILVGAMSGDMVAQWELFSLMEDSWDRLAKNLNEVKQAVKKLDWVVQPYAQRGEDPTALAQEKADVVEAAMGNWLPEAGTLEYDFEGAIYHGLDALSKGISVQEIRWQLLPGSGAGGNGKPLLVPKSAHLLTPRQYGWNDAGTKLGLIQEPGRLVEGKIAAFGRQGWWEFPRNQFWVGQWQARSGPAAMTALLRPLVPYWVGFTYGWRWLMQTAQLFGVPFRWATYAEDDPALLDKIKEMLENMGSAGWAAFPQGTVLEFKEAMTTARDNPQAFVIDLANRACDLLILGQELSGESAATGLGSGVADLQGQVRQEVLHRAAWWIADVMNYQFVPAVLELNFGEVTEPPVIAPDMAAGIDPQALVARDEVLHRMGVPLPMWWMLERHNIPELQPGEEALERPQPTGMGFGTEGHEGNEGPQVQARGVLPIRAANAATERLIENTLEELTGVQAKWLAGVKPFFRRLIAAAQDGSVSDEDFVRTVEAAHAQFPELFRELDHDALAEALEAAMGAAVVNGAVRGGMERGRVAQRAQRQGTQRTQRAQR